MKDRLVAFIAAASLVALIIYGIILYMLHLR
jgi:hypothetical protein